VTRRLAVLVAACLFVLAACSGGSGSSPSASSVALAVPSVAPSPATTSAPSAAAVELTVFGAASLKGVLEQARTAYKAATPGVTLVVSTDSSAALATQITQGAPAEVFLSADTTSPQKLVTAGLSLGEPVTFAKNLLTVIAPTANPGGITTPADLAKAGTKVIAAGDHVPITKYATMLVANLARQPGYPADYTAKYTANIASKEDNVAAVRSKIELGEGDGAIVYVTDAKASAKVTSIPVPDDANVPATYAGMVVKSSKQPEAAQAFLTWFAGPDGQAILASAGFLPPS
jgi:molybdate transport system substrate-binding protein